MKYLEMSRKFICSVAMPLALMFAACSDDKSVAGGSAEETGIVALENITIAGRAARLAQMPENAGLLEWTGAAEEGAVIRLSELDSVTLAPTGEFYFSRCTNSLGEFSFDSITLHSPYVMLELAPYVENEWWEWDGNWNFPEYDSLSEKYTATYSVIVDLRNMENVDINVVTYLESSRIRNLVNQGKAFETAKQQADGEILETLGMYGDAFTFDKNGCVESRISLIAINFLGDFIWDWSMSAAPSQIADAFGLTGKLSAHEEILDFFVNEIYNWSMYDWVTDSMSVFLGGFMAGLYDLGECSADRDGYSAEFTYDEYRMLAIACREKNWLFSVDYVIADGVDAVRGFMDDTRDGKSYKTVTYNIDGELQTWLAENLKYNSADGLYSISESMNLPDSLVWLSSEDCMEMYQDESLCYTLLANEMGVNYERLWNIVDSVENSVGVFQGICPEGWHLPSGWDWEKLRNFVEERIDVSKRFIDPMALVGFGETIPEISAKYAVKIDSSFTGEFAGPQSILLLLQRWQWSYGGAGQINHLLDDGAEMLFVRCVKN